MEVNYSFNYKVQRLIKKYSKLQPIPSGKIKEADVDNIIDVSCSLIFYCFLNPSANKYPYYLLTLFQANKRFS